MVITDFGIAGGLHGQEEGTGTRVPIGTPAYMSPEKITAQLSDGELGPGRGWELFWD